MYGNSYSATFISRILTGMCCLEGVRGRARVRVPSWTISGKHLCSTVFENLQPSFPVVPRSSSVQPFQKKGYDYVWCCEWDLRERMNQMCLSRASISWKWWGKAHAQVVGVLGGEGGCLIQYTCIFRALTYMIRNSVSSQYSGLTHSTFHAGGWT